MSSSKYGRCLISISPLMLSLMGHLLLFLTLTALQPAWLNNDPMPRKIIPIQLSVLSRTQLASGKRGQEQAEGPAHAKVAQEQTLRQENRPRPRKKGAGKLVTAPASTAAPSAPAEFASQSATTSVESEAGGGEGTSGEGDSGGGGQKGDALAEYLLAVRDRINRNKFYPSMAKKLHIQGKVELEILIENSGRILDYKIVSSSLNEQLDEAAKQTIAQIDQFSGFPPEIKQKSIRVILPIFFKLES